LSWCEKERWITASRFERSRMAMLCQFGIFEQASCWPRMETLWKTTTKGEESEKTNAVCASSQNLGSDS
jgi:hypothetical protein